MARVTSSRTRSQRKPSSPKPISTGSARGRQARARVSQAKVTSASNGKPTGSASGRVTTGRGGAQSAARKPSAQAQDAKRWQQLNNTKSAKAGKAAEPKPAKPAPGNGNVLKRATDIGKAAKAKAAQQKAASVSKAMTQKLKAAAAKRTAAGGLKAGVKAAVFAEGVTSRNTGDGTLTAAQKRGDYKPNKGPAVPERLTQKGVDKKTFDDAFRQARKSGQKEFTWRGKRYNTKLK